MVMVVRIIVQASVRFVVCTCLWLTVTSTVVVVTMTVVVRVATLVIVVTLVVATVMTASGDARRRTVAIWRMSVTEEADDGAREAVSNAGVAVVSATSVTPLDGDVSPAVSPTVLTDATGTRVRT
jgi:hypothetical protein